MSEEYLDNLIAKRQASELYSERVKLFWKIVEYLNKNWTTLVCWSGFDAWGCYYVSPDKKRCIYVNLNDRLEPPGMRVREIEFRSPEDLVNYIWAEEKGTIPFKRIAERVKDIFGVEVKMSEKNKLIRMWFGEAADG